MYPIKFTPIYKSYLWGGRNLADKLHRTLPEGKTAESWELSCRDDGMSIVSNGKFKGMPIIELIRRYGKDLLGIRLADDEKNGFPILIKIIDANDKLSVQVHPDDAYAKRNGDACGKTEMWYILSAKPGAKLVFGLKENITREDFVKSIESGKVGDILNEVPVSTGDMFYIPAGTVHALLDGILVAEIQQNSNTTYRLYDWDRVDANGTPRELHTDKALDVINFNFEPSLKRDYPAKVFDNYITKQLISNEYFSADEITVKSDYTSSTDGTTFYVYIVIEGEGCIEYSEGVENISTGDTVLIPACLGKHRISGKLKMLRAF